MIAFDDAVAEVLRLAQPLANERVAIGEAAGRVLGAEVRAGLDAPRNDVSAMDGYAVRDADLGQFPACLTLAGESFAGQGWDGAVMPRQCVRIFTGAPVPDGTDRIVIQENVARDGEVAIIAEHPGAARHIRERGSDFRAGDVLLKAGRLLDYRAVVAAAAADLDGVDVVRQPRITILGTGDELAEPGTAAATAGTIPESVSFGVAALAQDWGGRVVERRRLRDDLDALESAAAAALEQSDLIVVTGGASVGERDFAKTMFTPHGLELVFSKVAIKPGKPVWLGRAGGKLVMGLPGNPTSALVTARLLLAPLVAGLAGRQARSALDWRQLPLAGPLKGCGPRETFHRARLVEGTVEIISNQDSSAQRALAEADLLVRQLGGSPARPAGELVEVLAF